MDGASERRIVYVLCLVVLVLGLAALERSLNLPDMRSVGVSLALIAVSIVTAVAASRSGAAGGEIDETAMGEG